VLLYYNESIPDALITLFPEVSFDKSKFHVSHSMCEGAGEMVSGKGREREKIINIFSTEVLWRDITNRRKFFENYAKDQRFDSLVPTNWYNQSKHSLMLVKVIYKLRGLKSN
jgi:hypothetical protein